ncbi:unnamed protein product [Dicrocoelium dendriticum]|nr:unnamed protein product [Dicrocoelium dendriticum]
MQTNVCRYGNFICGNRLRREKPEKRLDPFVPTKPPGEKKEHVSEEVEEPVTVPTKPHSEKEEQVTEEMKETVKEESTTSVKVTTKPTTLMSTKTTAASGKLHVSAIGLSLTVLHTASLALKW